MCAVATRLAIMGFLQHAAPHSSFLKTSGDCRGFQPLPAVSRAGTMARGNVLPPWKMQILQMNEKLPAPCEGCDGSGLRHGAVCSECRGKGYRLIINRRQTPVQQQDPQQLLRPPQNPLASR
jgi:hypothetical protein